MSNTISLCIIAKNEARLIGQCIKSALPYVDQVVVVDTGSSDQTKDIAKGLGAEVWDYTWINDFSAARNYSLEKARCQWILYMDCDEEIDHGTGDKLLAAVKSNHYDAYYIKIKNLFADDKSLTFQSIRLFRNLPQFRFQGKIHEQISYAINKFSSKERIGQIDFMLIHHGYNPEKVNINTKIVRNLTLLEEQQSSVSEPDGFLLYNIGIEHVRQGQFQQALESFIKSLKVTNVNAGYAPILANKTIVCLIQLGRYRDALKQLTYFQSLYPDYSNLYLLVAVCHIQCGRYSLAAEKIIKAQSIKSDHLNYPVEETIFNYQPEQLLTNIQPLMVANSKQFELDVFILAKNEEKNIAKCIGSVSELADRVNVITTDCTDNTLNIAYQMGADIYRLNWNNNFNELRNFAIQRAKGDWILLINGDEEVQRIDLPIIVSHLNKSEFEAHRVKLRTFYKVNNFNIYTDHCACRLIRNKKIFCYRSRLLEDIEESIKDSCGDSSIASLPVTIYHYGPILKEQSKNDSFIRNISIIAEELKISDDKSPLYQAMGDEFYRIGKFNAAYGHYKRSIELSKLPIPAELWYGLSYCLYKKGLYNQVLETTLRAINFYPDYTDLIYLRGKCYLKQGMLAEAAQCFTKCLELGDSRWEEYQNQQGMGTFLAHCGLAEVLLRQGNLTKSLEHYRIAASHPVGLNFAIPPLVTLIAKHYCPEYLLEYLLTNKLDTCQHLSVAAMFTHKMGCLVESLELWQAALNKLVQSKGLSHYPMIAQAMFSILGDIYKSGIENEYKCDQLLRVAKFFN